MLDRLRDIVQEVNAAKDLQTALRVIVTRVREAMNTQVCSVYLLDNDINCHVLMASEGLRQESVGHVSLQLDEGLVGLVARNAEPVNLEDAQSHPAYHYLSETGEEQFSSFLGVPIIHHRKVLGVLVVQHKEKRSFDYGEEAFLITLSAQLAGVIAAAEASGAIQGVSPSGQRRADTSFAGISGATGVAIGEAVVVFHQADLNLVPTRTVTDIDAELHDFARALNQVRTDIRQLSATIGDQIRPEEKDLFEVYLRMLDDDALGREVSELILQGNWAQGALAEVALDHIKAFEQMKDPYLRERATDIRDLCSRVLSCLQEDDRDKPREYPEQTVLVGEELAPSMLMEVPREKLVGLISVKGSGNSHVAILARTMGIPTVMGALDLPYRRLDGRQVIVDGYSGTVYGNPSEQLVTRYLDVIKEEEELVKGLEGIINEPCVTQDGHQVSLWVNTGLMSDVVRSLDHGAEGIGLFRTEVPFLLAERFPSEQEQATIYREQLQAFAPKKVTMRTLDIGGDKALPYFPIEEANPFLGWRGIRVTLDHPEIFIAQTRAMIRASEGLDNLQIMLPMVSNLQEVTGSIQIIKRALRELQEEGLDVVMPPIGVMIELPAAVYLTRAMCQMVDFVSIGSNDLTQYMLAVDRNNPRVADLYSSFHPAVLHALKHVVDAAHAEGKPVSICGEMAGDPASALLLMAMGFDILSMNASTLLKVKAVIRSVTLADAELLLKDVMSLSDPQSIRASIDMALYNAGVERLLRSSRTS